MSCTSPNRPDGYPASSTQPYVSIPGGLQLLTTIHELIVKQNTESIDCITGVESGNRYTIKNNRGEKLFYACEEENCCQQCCFGKRRSFSISVSDTAENEIFFIERESLEKIRVYSPRNILIGTVSGTLSLFGGNFKIKNGSGIKVLKIRGPALKTGNADFKIVSLNETTEIGKISKQWGGILKELFTDLDGFRISFPIDLDVRMKAVMIGACILIDFLYYER